MSKANINIRMDGNLKRDFDELCKELGLAKNDAFTVFAKKWYGSRGYLLRFL